MWDQFLKHKWALGAIAGIAGLSVAVMAFAVLLPQSEPEPTEQEPAALSQPVISDQPHVQPPPAPKTSRLDCRWIPDRTQLLASLRLSVLAGRGELEKAIQWVDSAEGGWGGSLGRVMGALGLAPRAVRRFTWACSDLSVWPDRAVAVIELEPGHDARAFRSAGDPTELVLAGNACRRLVAPQWPHPVAVLDEQTIVTGHESLLRELAARGRPSIRSKPIERLLQQALLESELVLLVDLDAARQARWRLPASLMDVWPAGQKAWHLMWELPQGIAFVLCRSDRLAAELAIVCEGETAAIKVRDALAELVAAGKAALAAQRESLTKRLQSGQMKSALAGPYDLLLQHGQSALQAARWELTEDVLWLRVDSAPSVPELAGSIWGNREAILGDWLAAARLADEGKQRGLLAELGGYHKAEHAFPPGAAGGALLPPETRLSWLAALLPYSGRLDWHRELQFGYPWNAPQNRPVTQRPLESVVNPALGFSRTESGFPVTHYVGVAGVGPDAASLNRDDARSGVFGYAQSARMDQIGDGASNTIAILGVAQRLGAWAAGGEATVRSLSRRPYVNGPDASAAVSPTACSPAWSTAPSVSFPRIWILRCWSSWPRSIAASGR